MNAVTPTQAAPEPKSQMVTGGSVAAFVPSNLSEAFRLAGAIHASGLAPQSLKSPDQVMVAMMAGAELGMKPFQAIQSFAVVNGRPSLWGDGFVAVLRANGIRIRQWLDGEGDALTAYCEITRPDNGEITTGGFSVADAKKAGLWGKQGPWQQYPKRMLAKRALGFAGRDGAADVLRGFQLAEEAQDIEVAAQVPRISASEALRADASQPTAALELVDQPDEDTPQAEDAEVTEAEAEAVTAQARDLFGGDNEGAQADDDVFPGDR